MTTRLSSYIKTICLLLWLSITSTAFYRDVRYKYKGYGIKYIFTLCMVASVIYTADFLGNIAYLEKALSSRTSPDIENILAQIPEIKYDGTNISSSVDSPHFIEDTAHRKIAAIDTEGNMTFSERTKIPMLLTANTIVINLLAGNKTSDIKLDYPTFLGTSPWTITENSMREYLLKSIANNRMIFIYIMPLAAIFFFLKIITKALVPMIILFSMSHLFGLNINIKTACRLSMFASGIFVISDILFVLFIPQLSIVAEILHMMAATLMVMSFSISK